MNDSVTHTDTQLSTSHSHFCTDTPTSIGTCLRVHTHKHTHTQAWAQTQLSTCTCCRAPILEEERTLFWRKRGHFCPIMRAEMPARVAALGGLYESTGSRGFPTGRTGQIPPPHTHTHRRWAPDAGCRWWACTPAVPGASADV